jgi:hypothetical protein
VIKYNLQKIANYNLSAAILIALLAAPVGLLRVLGQFWAGQYHKVIIPFIIVNSLIGIYVMSLNSKKIKYDLLCLFLLIFLFFGLTIGILNAGSARYMLSHFFGALFMLSLYLYSYNTIGLVKIDIIYIENISKKIFYSALVFITLFWVIKLFWISDLYLGIGPSYMILTIAYGLVKKKRWITFISILLFLLTGKRGPILAAFSVISLFYLIPFFKLRIISIAKIGFLLIIFVAFSFFLYNKYSDFFESIELLSGPINKILMVNPYLESYNPDLAYSGRNMEIELAFKKFNSSVFYLFTGMGYGWSYYFNADVTGSTSTNFFVHYIHIGPLNFLFLYGYFLFIPFIIILLYIIIKLYLKNIFFKVDDIKLIIGLYLIGDFVNSLSGYSYPINPIFWIFLAYASNENLINFKKIK